MDSERSYRMFRLMEFGIDALERRNQLLDAVDHLDGVGAGLPLDRQSETEGMPLNQPITLSSCTLSITLPSSPRRTGEPLR